jgi:hypothetical protein
MALQNYILKLADHAHIRCVHIRLALSNCSGGAATASEAGAELDSLAREDFGKQSL